jgi:hypothetical protein
MMMMIIRFFDGLNDFLGYVVPLTAAPFDLLNCGLEKLTNLGA